MATAARSGRWVITAPISRPPLLRPVIASREVFVQCRAFSHSAAPMKSSKVRCFVRRVPAWYQSRPNSPPPRRFATTSTPPVCIQASHSGWYSGVNGTLNPPYPYRSVGFRPSRTTSRRRVMNTCTGVPSAEGTIADVVMKSWGLKGTFGARQTLVLRSSTFRLSTDLGWANEEKVKCAVGLPGLAQMGPVVPIPGSVARPRGDPAMSVIRMSEDASCR